MQSDHNSLSACITLKFSAKMGTWHVLSAASHLKGKSVIHVSRPSVLAAAWPLREFWRLSELNAKTQFMDAKKLSLIAKCMITRFMIAIMHHVHAPSLTANLLVHPAIYTNTSVVSTTIQ